MSTLSFIEYLIERFKIEQKKRDRSGIYGFTYHDTESVAALTALFEKEQDYYRDQCQYFFEE